jgi:hypothetical protein
LLKYAVELELEPTADDDSFRKYVDEEVEKTLSIFRQMMAEKFKFRHSKLVKDADCPEDFKKWVTEQGM